MPDFKEGDRVQYTRLYKDHLRKMEWSDNYINAKGEVVNPNGDRSLLVVKFDTTPYQCVVDKKDVEIIHSD